MGNPEAQEGSAPWYHRKLGERLEGALAEAEKPLAKLHPQEREELASLAKQMERLAAHRTA